MEVNYKQLEMQNRLLESKLQHQIIPEAEEQRRRLLETKVYCAMYDGDCNGDIWTEADPHTLPSGQGENEGDPLPPAFLAPVIKT